MFAYGDRLSFRKDAFRVVTLEILFPIGFISQSIPIERLHSLSFNRRAKAYFLYISHLWNGLDHQQMRGSEPVSQLL